MSRYKPTGCYRGRPLRKIMGMRKETFGLGHIGVFKLECGHEVQRIGRYKGQVGKTMSCPECK